MYPENRIVRIKPLNLPKWHGKEGKESFARPRVVEALFDPKTGRYATGLTEEEEKVLSKVLNQDLSSYYNHDDPHPFWAKSKASRLELPNHTLILRLDNPYDYIKYKLALASKFVANNYTEWKEGKWEYATHYIEDIESDIKSELPVFEAKKKAYKLIDKLDYNTKRNILLLLTGQSYANKDNDFIDLRLGQIIEDDPKKFLSYAELSKDELNIRAFIEEAVMKNIIKLENGIYSFGDTKIGIGIAEAIEFFKKKENSSLYLVIKEKISKL